MLSNTRLKLTARRLRNECFFSAPQLKRDPLDRPLHLRHSVRNARHDPADIPRRLHWRAASSPHWRPAPPTPRSSRLILLPALWALSVFTSFHSFMRRG